ncbi:MAG: glucose-6-phosphate dehydrogenase [Thermoplasmata archaeon]
MSAIDPPPGSRQLFVAFGATGDLMRRMLLPSLYSATWDLPSPASATYVLGCSRHALSDRAFQQLCTDALVEARAAPRAKARIWSREFAQYQALGDGTTADYRRLAERVATIERRRSLSGNRVIYLALPAPAVSKVVESLGQAGLHQSPGWTRVVIEKPFGRDLVSARRLNRILHRWLDERQIYRIDHYLGKETVQNLLVFRFANMIFESLWSRERIDAVEITVAEDLGVEERAGYYDSEGALRDMVQSHLTQLLTLTAMEVPSSLDADEIRNEKVKVLRSLAPLRRKDVVLGQYTRGRSRDQPARGYRQEPGVRRSSATDTFVAMRVEVRNWRWQGTDFFLRTGKRLPTKSTQIVVRFRKPPIWFFPKDHPSELTANTLTITLQPDEGFELAMEIKRPGHAIRLATQRLHFRYSEAFGPLPDAYQTLLLDVMRGDQTLFVRADEVEESWRFYERILAHQPPVHPYAAGSWGPRAADALIARRGHAWSVP